MYNYTDVEDDTDADAILSLFRFLNTVGTHLGFCLASTSLLILMINITAPVVNSKKPKIPNVMPTASWVVVGDLFVLDTTVALLLL